MATDSKRTIKVFMASPGDLTKEREKFREAIKHLNEGFGDGANVEYEPLGWEDALASTGRRPQEIINRKIDECDVFILTMYRRWGQKAPDSKYNSYTEEEYHRALNRWKKSKAPEIFVFFKRVDAASEGDPGPQLCKVIEFKRKLEETRQVLYHIFDTPESFQKEVDTHLREYARGTLPPADAIQNRVEIPVANLEELEEAKEIAEKRTKEAEKANNAAEEMRLRLEAEQLQSAEDAAELSREGKIEFAREKLTKLTAETMDIRILSLGFEFFYRTGDLDTAEGILDKRLELSENNLPEIAAAWGNLGLVYKTRGELDRAEELYRKSLAIEEELGSKEGMAANYCNLGNVYQTRGELDRAEDMYRKSLAIEEELGHKEGMANNYGSLGVVYQTRGELARAEELYRKALAIEEELGRKEGMASNYGNLGLVYQTRGELDRAEELYRKSLAIEEELGRKEGMANNYGNLGVVYQTRGELDRAEEFYEKARGLYREIRSPNEKLIENWLKELRK